MTEKYTATCAVQPDDTVTANRQADLVRIESDTRGLFQAAALVAPANARTFARGIIALADAIDGGEAKPVADKAVKVGDLVRITAEYSDGPGRNTGKTGPLMGVDLEDTNFPYTVNVPGYGHCGAYEVVRADEPTPAPVTPQAVKVGDKFRVLVDNANDATVSVGDILTVTDVGRWAFDATDARRREWYFGLEHIGTELERVDELAVIDVPVSVANPRRLALLKEAQEIMGDTYISEETVIVARFLAGE